MAAPRGARVGVLAQPGLEGADRGWRSSGEDSGEGAGPSTCSISLPSAGEAGDAAFLFFPSSGHPRGNDWCAVVL